MSDTTLYILIAVAVLVVAIILVRLLGGGKEISTDKIESAETPVPDMTADVPEPVTQSPEPNIAAPASNDSGSGEGDPLTQIKGLGPKAEAKLNTLGIVRFEQVASWTDADIETVGAQLGDMEKRIARDRWVEQAGLLASGDIAAFEAKFGKLG